MSVASMTRFGLSAVASVGIVLGQLAGTAGLAQAQDFEDPWFEEAVMTGLGSVHPTIVASSPTPEGLKPSQEYKPTDPRRIVLDAKSFQVGETVDIQYVAFRANERVADSIYQYVPACPNKQCWKLVYEGVHVTDHRGSMTLLWATAKAEPGRYRFCTGGVEGCRARYAELELTAAPQRPERRTR